MTTIITIAAWLGGLIGIFAGRRLYPIWLGLVTYLFIIRIFDLAIFRSSDLVRISVSVAIGILVIALVTLFKRKLVKIVVPLGGFLVSASIAERLLEIIHPESGKFLVGAVLLVGGIAGIFLFVKLLDIDDSLILLSAVWGAGLISLLIIDVVDILLISASGIAGQSIAGILDFTLLIQTILWIGLALLGIFVQRRLVFEPIPVELEQESEEQPVGKDSAGRRTWVMGILIGVLLLGVLLVGIVATNQKLSKRVRTAITDFEHSLGLEAEAPGDAPWRWAATLVRPQISLSDDDRILVLVPHPDDDILSTAGLTQQALEKGLPVKVVWMTVGDYNETSFALYRKEITLDPTEALRLGETRREEATAAQGLLGVTPEQIVFLGYPDGGGLEIFEKHWGENESYEAMLSRKNAVPYSFAQSPGAPFVGESIVADIQQVVEEFQPTKIFTSHPGDVHPDHQTVPLYLQIALWNLEDEIDPEVYHFITHYGRWPQPRGYQPEHPLEPPSQYDVDNRWLILPITPEQRETKLQALQAHKTQWGSGQPYLESVVRANELFDVISEIPVAPGKLVEILPAEIGFDGEALAHHSEDHQEAFLDGDLRTLHLDGDELVLDVELEAPLEGDLRAKIWVMGYRTDTPFEEMPKIFIEISGEMHKVHDRGQELPADSVTVISTPTRHEVRIPLSLLDDPERIMLTLQTHKDDVPMDNIPWLFLNLQPEE